MIKMILTITRRKGMAHEESSRYQRDVHRPLLMAIPEARRYMRRSVVSLPIPARDYSGPGYHSGVEGWSDGLEDMNALYFLDTVTKQVDPDHKDFMDRTAHGSTVTHEDVIVG